MTIKFTSEHACLSARLLLEMYGLDTATTDAQQRVICVNQLDPQTASRIAADLALLAGIHVQPLEVEFGGHYLSW